MNGLLIEYRLRYNKKHKTEEVYEFIESFLNNVIKNNINWNDNKLTPFVLAMPNEYKTNDPTESYRNYYINEKKEFAKWKNGNIPWWWK